MADVPSRRIDRAALERIIQRAAELQAGELDAAGDGMTEQELLKVGADVGIDGRFLRQAMYEDSSGAGATTERGILVKWIGPARAGASRVVPGDKASVEAALAQWMTEGEALSVKRRLPDATVWERQRGFMAEVKRGFGVGGRGYHLAKARDVSVRVTQLESGFCHVEITADLQPMRNGAAGAAGGSSAVLAVVGLATFALSGPLPLIVALGAIPLGASILAPVIASKSYGAVHSRVQLGLEQVLDRLEQGEIKPRHASESSPLYKLAVEVRKAITEASQPKRLPPTR